MYGIVERFGNLGIIGDKGVRFLDGVILPHRGKKDLLTAEKRGDVFEIGRERIG